MPAGGVAQQSIGIETKGGVFTVVIRRGTPLPVAHCEIFTTADAMQASVQIRVFRGDGAQVADNAPLGVFEILGFRPGDPGTPQIQVTFHADEAETVTLTARELTTGWDLPVYRS
jgi:molecular chaperone DnaK